MYNTVDQQRQANAEGIWRESSREICSTIITRDTSSIIRDLEIYVNWSLIILLIYITTTDSQSIDESENNDYLGRLGEVAPDATAAAAAAKTSLLRRESREGLFSRRDDMLRLVLELPDGGRVERKSRDASRNLKY